MTELRIGLIGRADDGGLGTMTQEFARHLHPAATLVVELDEPRGVSRPDRFVPHSGQVYVNPRGARITDEALRWLLARSDVIYTAEYHYREDLWYQCNRAHVPTVLHAMPELYDCKQTDRPTTVCVPTEWQMERMPNDTVLLPVPVATERFRFTPRTIDPSVVEIAGEGKGLRFLHKAAPAMLDRNGTRTVVNALPHVQRRCSLTILGSEQLRLPRHTNVEVRFDPWHKQDYWEGYDEHDVLLMPRRYAGLSLPVQEAAAAGLPTIMTDVAPNDFYTDLRVPVRPDHATTAQMKGGWFTVYDGDPEALAAEMDRLGAEKDALYDASLRAGLFSKCHSWERLEVPYRRMLTETARRVP